MIGYTTVGSNNLEHSATFYDGILKLVGASRVMEGDDFIAWGNSTDGAMFSIHLPANGESASIGNGVMIALKAKDQTQVEKIYTKALELGASDEGKPGFRMEGFYAAYFRDLDGNKLNVHCMV
jgi:hypothetical protein